MKGKVKSLIAVALAFTMLIPSTITTVFAAGSGSFHGTFTSTDGTAISGMSVKMRSTDGTEVGTTTTDENGDFKFTGLETGGYFVEFDSASYEPSTEDADEYNANNGYAATVVEGQDSTFIKGQPKLVRVNGELSLVKTQTGNNNPVADAKYAITKEGATDAIVKTTDENGSFVFHNIAFGKYIIKEIEAPDGYTLNETEYVVDVSAATPEVKVETTDDILGSVKLIKTDAKTGQPLVGVEYTLKKGDSVVDVYTTDANGEVNVKGLALGNYVFVETKALDNYILDNTELPFTISNENPAAEVSATNKPYATTTINKYAIDSTDPVVGANLQIKQGDTVVAEITTTDHPWKVTLAPGEYTLSETVAPDGFLKAEDITFTVTDKDSTVTMYDDYTKVHISKQDITTKAELPGAKLRLVRADGTFIQEWTSTNVPHVIEKLKPGTYMLSETTAPDGYLKAETVTFTVDAKGDVQPVIMYDNYTKVDISKQDITTKKELAGAKLTLAKQDGTIVDEWVSTTTPHRINKLEAGTYVLTEVTAPEGYRKAESITFTVNAVGEVQKVTMYDQKDVYDITITKVDAKSGKKLAGASLKLVDSDGNTVESWESTTSEHVIKGLKPGKYTLKETKAPDGYFKGDDMTIELKANGQTKDLDFKYENEYTRLKVYKYKDGTETFVKGAKLHIEDEDGKTVASWTTDDSAYVVEQLAAGTYKLVEDSAPDGYAKADSITFKLKETGETQSVKMYDKATTNKTTTDTTSNTTSTSSIATGDSAPIILLISLMMASLCACVVAFVKKKTNK